MPIEIVNTTPHALTFQRPAHPADCGECAAVAPDICGDAEAANVLPQTFEVPASGVVISATPVEEPAGRGPGGVELVRTTFRPSADAEVELAALEAAHPGAVIVGSIIAAQAFPGRLLALVPAAGFERVPPEQKRMRADKFTTFEEVWRD